MITAFIAEDEAAARELIRTALKDTGRVRVAGEAATGDEALAEIQSMRVDVVFLDVQMPDMTGIEVAEALVEEGDPPQFVFVTGHGEWAAKAFELEAVDYVVKPTDPAEFGRRLAKAVDRVERSLEQESGPDIAELREQVSALASRVGDLSGEPAASVGRRLPIKDYDEGTVRLIEPRHVVYLIRRGDRVVVHTADQEFPTYYTVDQMEQRLGSSGFVRINPGALVNINFVDHLIPNGDGSYDLVLGDDNATVLTASRRRSKALMEFLKPE
jgi:DNA-binding LytR/AlgR family response regulator